MKTRDKILITALKLFNMYGVSNVTLRRIASEMFISQGNLNYHFKHREDLIEALFEQFVEEFEKTQSNLSRENFNFQLVYDITKQGMDVFYKYRFLVIDLNQNVRENPKILHKYKQIDQARKQSFLLMFNLATQMGVMRAQAFEKEYEGLIDRICIFSDYWLAAATVFEESLDGMVAKYHNLLVEMLFPYFSREAQREFLLKRL